MESQSRSNNWLGNQKEPTSCGQILLWCSGLFSLSLQKPDDILRRENLLLGEIADEDWIANVGQ